MSSLKEVVLTGAAGLANFLNDAVHPLMAPKLRTQIVLLVALATLTTVVLATHASPQGERPGGIFVATAVARLAGLLLLQIAILREITASRRGRWTLDAAFWLHALTLPLGIALSESVQKLLGASPNDSVSLLLAGVLLDAITAPLAPWLVAIAVEKPLAWRPGPWFRRWSLWLAPLMFWGVALRPLAVTHSSMNTWLLEGSGEWFWPLAVLDGALSGLLFLVTLGLNAAAYRRVAGGAPNSAE